jgi:hypothetical protein
MLKCSLFQIYVLHFPIPEQLSEMSHESEITNQHYPNNLSYSVTASLSDIDVGDRCLNFSLCS